MSKHGFTLAQAIRILENLRRCQNMLDHETPYFHDCRLELEIERQIQEWTATVALLIKRGGIPE